MAVKTKPDGERLSQLSNEKLRELSDNKKGLRAQKARNELVKRERALA